ncbi:diguanylate phosphodiesterase [Acetobacter okinawensis]|uniref:diguanylate phosphodiesterase n=1 Tax=Acetobacter okinawensis TaxID=1076594 RepID=UPI001BADA76F|nr:diguanylate phosphodiesterase [Acetobacter okinawensis]MBS0967243.1 diguanylate phosphodiesterase [Acetobacter okinawensis]MCP1214414.1 diguanylate phosphodiesterase [Acetobacter okinawensis]
MLTVLVYRSKKLVDFSELDFHDLNNSAQKKNIKNGITGVLLYDGNYFLQILEGDEEQILKLYHLICMDSRHHNFVKIIETQIPLRYFTNLGMTFFDIREKSRDELISEIKKLNNHIKIEPYYNKILRIIYAFFDNIWRDEISYSKELGEWSDIDVYIGESKISSYHDNLDYKFSVQPIINTSNNKISSYEFLLRTGRGGSPYECFSSLNSDEIYNFDIISKKISLEWASRFIEGNVKISINLLPNTLLKIPNTVEILLKYVKDFNLHPGQIIVEITEEEAISQPEKFTNVIKKLHSFGFGIAIDDFGAGFAGLSLITKFQPEKIKIDRVIVSRIHEDGPRQMIVRSVVNLCRALGIEIVAEGVEQAEEWEWLKSVGIELFQGFLFSKPSNNAMLKIRFPPLDISAVTLF